MIRRCRYGHAVISYLLSTFENIDIINVCEDATSGSHVDPHEIAIVNDNVEIDTGLVHALDTSLPTYLLTSHEFPFITVSTEPQSTSMGVRSPWLLSTTPF